MPATRGGTRRWSPSWGAPQQRRRQAADDGLQRLAERGGVGGGVRVNVHFLQEVEGEATQRRRRGDVGGVGGVGGAVGGGRCGVGGARKCDELINRQHAAEHHLDLGAAPAGAAEKGAQQLLMIIEARRRRRVARRRRRAQPRALGASVLKKHESDVAFGEGAHDV